MINELLFFTDIIIVASASLAALCIGKEALIAFICMQGVLSNLFVTKQMTLFGFAVTCSDVFAVGALFGLNLLQEFFDRTLVKKAIISNFLLLLFYLAISQIQILYIPNNFDTMHSHFSSILTFMPRIASASIATYLIVQVLDAYFYQLLKKVFSGKYLLLRTTFSLICSQLIDTILFSFLGLYGIVGSIGDVIFVSFIIKLIIIGCTSPFCTLAKKIVTRIRS